MGERVFAARELARVLGVLSHPDRIRIVGELRHHELDVNSIRGALGLTQARVSQQLALMRSHRLVSVRREGRHVYYRLNQPLLADWLVEGLAFVEGEAELAERLQVARGQAQELWGGNGASGSDGETSGEESGKEPAG